MKILDIDKLPIPLLVIAGLFATNSKAEDLAKVTADLRLRYEHVEQDNRLLDADALTLRTRINVTSKTLNGFSVVLDVEDSRSILGLNDYNNTLGENQNRSVIADPETTEVDQAFVQYKLQGFTAKLGRQVITYDNHRFLGHVGFRQDRQAFDGVSLSYDASSALSLNYAHISKRNRIFSDEKDIDSKDHLLNLAYKTSLGKLTAYAYLLELDTNETNSLDSYGLRFTGKRKSGAWNVLYTAEYANQKNKTASQNFDVDYALLELGASVSGVTAKLGYELLGSDDGYYGFSTPLATLHKFNGWTDQFLATPAQGLKDRYVSVSGKAFGGKWLAVYHDFSSDESSVNSDLGNEIGLQFVMPFAKRYSLGVKYAKYSAGDVANNKVDTDKLWLWVGAKF